MLNTAENCYRLQDFDKNSQMIAEIAENCQKLLEFMKIYEKIAEKYWKWLRKLLKLIKFTKKC